MARYTRTPVSTLQGINNELAKVELAMKDTLDRKGVTPNFMDANLDMNSRRVLNLPAPLTDQEPLRRGDLATGSNISFEYAQDTYLSIKEFLISKGLSGNYGFFEQGFSFVNEGDVGIDSDNKLWLLGTGSATVTAGTTPSSPDYERVSSYSFLTVAQLQEGSLQVGDTAILEDRGLATFEVVTGGTPNGLDVLDAGNGNTAVIKESVSNLDARWYGLSEDRGDNQLPIQAMIDDVGFFVLPPGVFDISDTIYYRGSTKSLGSVWRGAGKETSTINCVGMGGKSAIAVDGDVFVRLELADFKVTGFCDYAISLETATRETFQTKLSRLRLFSGNDTVRISRPFSVEVSHVDADSNNGHCFYTLGGNTVQFSNCYAHSVGVGKAGYRILGRALLVSCNGIDETTGDRYWGWFGDLATNKSYQITAINCNAEDFGSQGAILCENFGNLSIQGMSFLPRSTGTYDNIIHLKDSGNNRVYLDSVTSVSSKGATLSGESNLKAAGLTFGLSMSTSFTDYRDKSVSITYPLPYISTTADEFGVTALSINNLHAERDYSYETPVVKTWTVNSPTYDGTKVKSVKTANTSATSITNCTGLREGTTLHLLIKDTFTTIRHSIGGEGRFVLKSGADELLSNGDVLTFVANGSSWVQM